MSEKIKIHFPQLFHYFVSFCLLLILVGIFISIVILQIGVALLLMFLPYVFYRKLKERDFSLMEILIIGLFISGLISTITSKNSSISVPNLPRYFLILSAVPVLFFIAKNKIIEIRNLAFLIVILSSVCAISGIYHYSSGIDRTVGFYGGYFTLAILLVFSLPISIALFISSPTITKVYLSISLVLQFTALWLTFTRSAFLAIIIGCSIGALALLIHYLPNLTKRRIWEVLAVAIFPLVLVILMLSSSDARINPKSIAGLGSSRRIDFSSGRKQIISNAVDIINRDIDNLKWKRLLVGHGLNSRKIYYPDTIFRSWESDYLESILSQGLFGLLIVIFIYILFIRQIIQVLIRKKTYRENMIHFGFAISGAGYVVMSFLTHVLLGFSSSLVFFILYGILADTVSEPEVM
jgi:hypothetical protein